MASPFDEDWVMDSDDMDDAERAMLLLDNLKGNAVRDIASTVLSPTQPFDLWTDEEEASFLVDGHSNVSETQLLPFFPKWASEVGPDAASCARALDVAALVASLMGTAACQVPASMAAVSLSMKSTRLSNLSWKVR